MDRKLFENVKNAMMALTTTNPDGDPREVITGVVSIFRDFIHPESLAQVLAVLLLQTQELNAAIETLKRVDSLKNKTNSSGSLN